MLGHLPAGTKGFDCNTTVTADAARRFYDAGYRFAIRYVRRAQHHAYDMTVRELADLLRAGLGVMVVQHVAPPGWVPTAGLGRLYGETAALEANEAGVSAGCTLWCDLEGVAKGVPHADVIAFCNAWYGAARSGGYSPGLYVGDSCGLTATELYHRLKFRRYWSAYNLNRDEFPAVRGVQMRQHAAIVSDRVPGIPYEFDVNLIGRDAMGDSPHLLLPRASHRGDVAPDAPQIPDDGTI
jgi:hypothetical protein